MNDRVVIPFRRPPLEDTSSPLLSHLQNIASEGEIDEVIKLLHDIRTHQDHPEMQKAFSESHHPVAHGAKDHDADILELIVKDYLRDNDLEDEEAHEHKEGLTLHIKHVLAVTLRDYHRVVETIRLDVEEVANHLRADDSIGHIRDMIANLKDYSTYDKVDTAISDLEPHHVAHHVFHGHHEDVDHALAVAAAKEGYHHPEAALAFLHSTFHGEMEDHFGEAMDFIEADPPLESDMQLTDLGKERARALDEGIEELRLGDSRINGALGIMEQLNEFEAQPAPESFEQAKKAGENLDQLVVKYLRMRSGEPHIRDGLMKLSAASNMMQDHRAAQVMEMIPGSAHELKALMGKGGKLEEALINLWFDEDYGNVEHLGRLVDDLASQAQIHLNLDSLRIELKGEPHGEEISIDDLRSRL